MMSSTSVVRWMTELLEVLGVRIKELRVARGMTQKQLASLAGISLDYVGDIEYGRYRMTVTVLVQIAQALGTDGWTILQHAERNARK
jgi:transcriptional regulator with XRE-family HTH domain